MNAITPGDFTAITFGGIDLTPYVSGVDLVIPVEADTTYQWQSVLDGLKPGSLSIEFQTDDVLGAYWADVMRVARRKYQFSRPRPLPIDGNAYRRRVRNRRKR